MTTVRIIGPGRAGGSLSAALRSVDGYRIEPLVGRARPVADAARGVDLLVIATPDAEVSKVSRAVDPVDGTVVAHLSGSLGLDVLAPHVRRASLHPLIPLPTPAIGAERLRSGATFAVAGDTMVSRVAADLGGRTVEVPDEQRVSYHAAAAIAANHVVALLGQVERVAAAAGLPLDAFAGLIRCAVDDALSIGPSAALTGPAGRGDWETVDRHRMALASMSGSRTELAAYDALVSLARRLSLDAAVMATVSGTPDAAGTADASGVGQETRVENVA